MHLDTQLVRCCEDNMLSGQLTLCLGLFILPYVFGGELFPNRLRSFGGALSQCFHCTSLLLPYICTLNDFLHCLLNIVRLQGFSFLP